MSFVWFIVSFCPPFCLLLCTCVVGQVSEGMQELVQVESLAQVGVQLLLFTLGLEFSLQKLKAVRSVALIGVCVCCTPCCCNDKAHCTEHAGAVKTWSVSAIHSCQQHSYVRVCCIPCCFTWPGVQYT